MSNEVKEAANEEVQPNAVVVPMQVMQAVLKYLNTQPRGAVNQLAVALEKSTPVHIKQDTAVSEDKPQSPPSTENKLEQIK